MWIFGMQCDPVEKCKQRRKHLTFRDCSKLKKISIILTLAFYVLIDKFTP